MELHIAHATIHINGGADIAGQLLELPLRSDTDILRASPFTPPTLGEVWPGQGGRYVGILPAIGTRPAQYMIAGDQESKLKWGPYEDIEGARSRHDGRANTAALMAAGGNKFPAAWWCSDMQIGPLADYHLPSQAELFLASLYAPNVFAKEGWYWSSTQHSRSTAFIQDFELGYSRWGVKDGGYRVRAVRWIQLQPLNA